MANLTGPQDFDFKTGMVVIYGVKASTSIMKGGLLQFNGGYIEPWSGGINKPFAGIALEGTMLPIGSSTVPATDGWYQIKVMREGMARLPYSGANISYIGQYVYAADDNVLTCVPAGGVTESLPIGLVVDYDSAGYVWVDISLFTGLNVQGGIYCLTVPYTKQTAEFDTGFKLAGRTVVHEVINEVITNVAASTVSCGLLSSQTGGNATGFVNASSCANAGFVDLVLQNTTGASSNTIGAYLYAHQGVKSADGTPVYAAIKKPFVTDTVVAKNISITTSNHTIAGKLHILYTVV